MKHCFAISLLISAFLRSSAQSGQDSLYAKANSYFLAREYSKAIPILRELTLKLPDKTYIWLSLAEAYCYTKNYDSTQHILASLDKNSQNDANVLDIYVKMYLWSENYEEAIRFCDKTISLYPDFTKFLLTKVYIYQKLNRKEEALTAIKKFYHNNLSSPEAKSVLNLLENNKGSEINNR